MKNCNIKISFKKENSSVIILNSFNAQKNRTGLLQVVAEMMSIFKEKAELIRTVNNIAQATMQQEIYEQNAKAIAYMRLKILK